jgi:23S rRNA pseudouridine2605 synthase
MFKNNKKKITHTRLNKFIASSGLCSRRKADELIEAGKVKVNGVVVKELGYSVSSKDKVTVNNEPLKKQNLIYIKYYKPAGYITTMNDEKGRKTIYDILPEEVKDLKPVGRLDKDSTGLLILTNDGEFINKMTHPSIKLPKIYRVCAQGKMNSQHLLQMAKGIEIEPQKIAYADALIVEYENKNTVLQITLYQGMNRQIRKMLDHLGHPVISLKRVSHGTINIQGLKKGQFKYIKPKEINDLIKHINKLEKQAKK